MAGKKEETENKKPDAFELTSQHLGDVHYRVFKLRDYFNSLNDVVHYYLNKFGPYLPAQARADLAILALKADKIAIDLSKTIYDVRILRAQAQMHIDTDAIDEFSIPENVAEELSKSIKEMEMSVSKFAEQLNAFIHQIIETARREGIA